MGGKEGGGGVQDLPSKNKIGRPAFMVSIFSFFCALPIPKRGPRAEGASGDAWLATTTTAIAAAQSSGGSVPSVASP
jgi:hypothetical protein